MMFQSITTNYYNYYKIFAQSDIIHLYEGSVSWIIPCERIKGPSIAFRVHLKEESAETELKTFIQGIREGKVPKIWHITPDATPNNIIDIMKKNGFKDVNVLEEASGPEPAMSLHKNDFIPYTEDNSPVICRKISKRKILNRG